MGMSSCVSVSNRQRSGQDTCRCAGCPRAVAEPIERPKSSKMNLKVLKKIKKKIGFGRNSCIGGNTGALTSGTGLPPLGFHSCHGDNMRISRDGSSAHRYESFCKGVVFSSRPVAVNEKVCIRFTEMSTNWSGVLRFGFTSHDPATMTGVLPKYACPDLTNKSGHWAKALAERLCDTGSLLQYYVNSSGDVHFAVDGDDKGIFFTGVDTKTPLWALLDVYGNCTGIQLIDSRSQLNNARREINRNVSASMPVVNGEDEIDRNLIPALRATTITDEWRPALLHSTYGRHIRIGPEPGIATRIPREFCQGYVFTARPLAPGERLMIRIMDTDNYYTGALALGLTSCDPARLTPADLPDNSDMFLDRPEYWVVSKDVAGTPRVGEELVLSVSGIGEVKVARNGCPPITVMHVDYSLKLWAFLDIYGNTRTVQILSRPPPAVLVVALPPAHNAANHLVAASRSQMQSLQTVSSSSSTTSLPVSLVAPLSPPSLANHRNTLHQASTPYTNGNQHQGMSRISSPNLISHIPPTTMSEQAIQLPQNMSGMPTNANAESQLVAVVAQSMPPSISSTRVLEECTICYEKPIDSVLYMCGHMCMCYRCGVQQWRGIGGGQCPMCRAPIKDVIRTYKS